MKFFKSFEFIALIATLMGISAFGIDAILPAFPTFAQYFALHGERANDVQLVVYVFMFGFSIVYRFFSGFAVGAVLAGCRFGGTACFNAGSSARCGFRTGDVADYVFFYDSVFAGADFGAVDWAIDFVFR